MFKQWHNQIFQGQEQTKEYLVYFAKRRLGHEDSQAMAIVTTFDLVGDSYMILVICIISLYLKYCV